jgi:hypothetical protein
MLQSPSFATLFAGVALAAAIGLSGCNHSSTAADNDAGDASDDDAAVDSGGIVIVLDATTGEDVTFDDAPTGNCALPDGTYTVTMTPMGDAGSPGCVPTTSTITFPLSTACSVTDQGMLPVCSISFSCTQGGMGSTTTTDGYIQVADGSYAGYETVQVVSTAVGMPILSTCSYGTEYAKQ